MGRSGLQPVPGTKLSGQRLPVLKHLVKGRAVEITVDPQLRPRKSKLQIKIALRLAMPVAAAMALVGFFAIFHGYAHGIETPETASGLLYGLGFVAATALLHGLGVGIGLLVGRFEAGHGWQLVRIAGSAAAVVGVALLANAI